MIAGVAPGAPVGAGTAAHAEFVVVPAESPAGDGGDVGYVGVVNGTTGHVAPLRGRRYQREPHDEAPAAIAGSVRKPANCAVGPGLSMVRAFDNPGSSEMDQPVSRPCASAARAVCSSRLFDICSREVERTIVKEPGRPFELQMPRGHFSTAPLDSRCEADLFYPSPFILSSFTCLLASHPPALLLQPSRRSQARRRTVSRPHVDGGSSISLERRDKDRKYGQRLDPTVWTLSIFQTATPSCVGPGRAKPR